MVHIHKTDKRVLRKIYRYNNVGLTSPCDTVPKIVGLPRWQREWINDHRSINFSGVVQEMLNDIIEKNDPQYFKANQQNLKKRVTRKREVTLVITR